MIEIIHIPAGDCAYTGNILQMADSFVEPGWRNFDIVIQKTDILAVAADKLHCPIVPGRIAKIRLIVDDLYVRKPGGQPERIVGRSVIDKEHFNGAVLDPCKGVEAGRKNIRPVPIENDYRYKRV